MGGGVGLLDSVGAAAPWPVPFDAYSVTDMVKLWRGEEVPANSFAATAEVARAGGGGRGGGWKGVEAEAEAVGPSPGISTRPGSRGGGGWKGNGTGNKAGGLSRTRLEHGQTERSTTHLPGGRSYSRASLGSWWPDRHMILII